MLLIGSEALSRYYPQLLLRPPRDTDAIVEQMELDCWAHGKTFDKYYRKGPKQIAFYKGRIYEFEIADERPSAKDLLKIEGHGLASLDCLYSLKMSHRFLKDSPHFLKTMRSIQKMRAAGAKIPSYLSEWFKKREKETYNYPHPNLNQMGKKFFNPNQGIKYVYDHDSIHIALARRPHQPAYTLFKDDQAEVKVSKAKFLALDFEDQIASVVEESTVLALERSQIPFPGVLTPRQSYLKALEKVCTSISSGWWREFAWEHYDEAVRRYDPKYVSKFQEAVKSGVVKPFDGVVRHMEQK